jgi:hypothetical protein
MLCLYLRYRRFKNNVYRLSENVWGQVGANMVSGHAVRHLSFVRKSALILWLAGWGELEILRELTSEISFFNVVSFP